MINFTKPHGHRYVALWGEVGRNSAQSAAGDISELRKKLADYDNDCIFNMDETSLFFKLLPCREYLAPSESRNTVRRIKAMKATDRVMASDCTNADGSAKVPVPIIGKPKNLRCFRLGTRSISNKTHGQIPLLFENGSFKYSYRLCGPLYRKSVFL